MRVYTDRFPLKCYNLELKYTNPARGILDFCKQKFYRPLLCSPWTLYSMYNLAENLKSYSERDREREPETCTNLKKPPPLTGGA